MAFEILNEAASVVYVLAGENRYPQAEPDKVDFDILAQGVDGEGVVSGAATTPQGIPDATVAVAAAVVRIAGTDVAFAGGNVNCGAAAAALPRFDLIAIDNAGVASAVNGVAAAVPVFPAVPANSVIVAAVWRAANDNTITAADIVDKRCLLLGATFGTVPTLIGIVGGIATPNRFHHTLSAQAGAADDLDGMTFATIIGNGEPLIIRPDSGDTITVKHNALGGADARNILCIGNADIVLDDDHDFVICIYATAIGAGSWMALGGGAGGGAPHNLLDGATHPDTVVQAPTRGSLIYGDSTPDWNELVVGAVNSVLWTDGVDASWTDTPYIGDTLRVENNVGIAVAPVSAIGLNVAHTLAAYADNFFAFRTAPGVQFLGNNRILVAVDGVGSMQPDGGSTGHRAWGLRYTMGAGADQLTAGETGTVAEVYGIAVTPNLVNLVAGATLDITEMWGLEIAPQLVNIGTAATVTTYRGIQVAAPSVGGTVTNTNYIGLQIDDETNASIVYPLWIRGNSDNQDHYSTHTPNLSLFTTVPVDVNDIPTGGDFMGLTTAAKAGDGVLGIGDAAAAPDQTSNPINGGILWCAGGALEYLGSGGTQTTLGASEPHCPICGTDFVLQWRNRGWGKHLLVCMWCYASEGGAGVIKQEMAA